MNRGVLFALGAAALFGASTPFAKLLTGDMPPVLLAGLLYLGSGVGLTLARLVRDGGFAPSGHLTEHHAHEHLHIVQESVSFMKCSLWRYHDLRKGQ
jgi:hypothetical protein